jgi:hypothetical protein
LTDKDLPAGVRLILIGALELVGTILGGAEIEEVRERAEHLFVIVTEHVEIEEEVTEHEIEEGIW